MWSGPRELFVDLQAHFGAARQQRGLQVLDQIVGHFGQGGRRDKFVTLRVRTTG